jgi:hypothetical protein
LFIARKKISFLNVFVGGIQENFDTRKLSETDKANFWKTIHNGFEKNAILGCSINVNKT